MREVFHQPVSLSVLGTCLFSTGVSGFHGQGVSDTTAALLSSSFLPLFLWRALVLCNVYG